MADRDLGFGQCCRCEEPAVVKLNGLPYCADHFGSALSNCAGILAHLTDE